MMKFGSAAVVVVALAMLSLQLRAADDKPPEKDKTVNVRELSQEVTALQTIYQMQLTRPQLVALKELARDTADTSPPDGGGKASDKLRKALGDFRDALVKAREPDKIADLAEALDNVQQAEKATLDDDLDVTEQARIAAPKAFKLLTGKQFAGYGGILADGIGDPAEELGEAIVKARGLKDKEWKELRVQIADDVGRLLGGVDIDKVDDFGNKAVQLLIIARGLNDEEFKKEKPELEKRIQALVGQVSAMDVVRNAIEHRLAELLSNPRLLAAIEARLK